MPLTFLTRATGANGDARCSLQNWANVLGPAVTHSWKYLPRSLQMASQAVFEGGGKPTKPFGRGARLWCRWRRGRMPLRNVDFSPRDFGRHGPDGNGPIIRRDVEVCGYKAVLLEDICHADRRTKGSRFRAEKHIVPGSCPLTRRLNRMLPSTKGKPWASTQP